MKEDIKTAMERIAMSTAPTIGKVTVAIELNQATGEIRVQAPPNHLLALGMLEMAKSSIFNLLSQTQKSIPNVGILSNKEEHTGKEDPKVSEGTPQAKQEIPQDSTESKSEAAPVTSEKV